MNLRLRLAKISDYLDVSGREVERITVKATRGYAMRCGARPERRGGPLRYRGRMVIVVKRGVAVTPLQESV